MSPVLILIERRSRINSVKKSVSSTAVRVCTLRAFLHDVNAINDPYAKHFIPPFYNYFLFILRPLNWITGAPMYDMEKSGLQGMLYGRTLMGQDLIKKCVNKDKVKNIVLLGAGLDTKFHRCDIPENVELYEVDTEPTQKFKIEKLNKITGHKINQNIIYAPVDFETQNFMDVLKSKGFDPEEATLFLWEGVTYYLNPEAVQYTLRTISINVKKAHVFLDFAREINEETLKLYFVKKLQDRVTKIGEPWKFGIEPENVEKYFSKYGFEIKTLLDWQEIRSRYQSFSNGELWEPKTCEIMNLAYIVNKSS